MPVKDRGFTLLEVIVVMTIIAVLTGVGVMMLRFDRGEQTLDDAVLQFTAFYRAAQDEALLGGSPLRWSLQEKQQVPAVELQKRQNGQWQPFQLDNRLIVALSKQSVTAAVYPRHAVYVFPSGQSSPFRLHLQLGERQRDIHGDSLGRLTVTTP